MAGRQKSARVGLRLAFIAGCLAVAAALAQSVAAMAAPKLMDWPDLLGRPLPAATEHFSYGPDPLQTADLWLPAGKGPFPVVVMVHGGCWLSDIAKLTIMNYAAEDLRRRGVAVWNIEYRGVDRPGGGYPGTFQDVAAATDMLAKVAPAHHLKLDRVVAVGHSAGSHFVLWLAARGRIPAGSALKTAHPLPIAGVVSLGGLPDLARDHREDLCGARAVAKLVGAPSASHPNIYADTSPAELGVGHEEAVQINGAEDPLAYPALAEGYAAKLRGARIRQIVVADTGHVELISPGTAAWTRAVEEIDAFLHSR
jgi:acetyl esterase/lipase